MRLEELTLQDFLAPLPCACGRTHQTALEVVELARGALARLPDVVTRLGARKVFLLADVHTARAAGEKALTLLREAGVEAVAFTFPDEDLVPDERALGAALMAYDRTCDLIVGVGSGTLNDISRFLSLQVGKPYLIVATAPSMDGYASTVAPLITASLKTTYEAHVPRAIVADLDVMADAPQEMVAAGFGDILGKVTCLCDWELAALITGEYYCPQVAAIMRLALRRVMACAPGLARREPDAMRALMEALVLAGIAMSYVGNSRPASGCEHHLSHFWEMRFLFEGRRPVLHGTKVGIGTVAALRLHAFLREERIDFDAAMAEAVPSAAQWEAGIRAAYRQAADGVIALERSSGKNARAARDQRLAAMRAAWPQISALLAELPAPEEMAALLRAVGGSAAPHEVGLDAETVRQSVLYAKELRNRYSLLQMLWDLGLLERYAARLAHACTHCAADEPG